MRILDNLEIKLKLRNFDENPLAIATLTINKEIEVRFCPILWKQGRTGLFFTMPSLKSYGFQSCFIVLNKEHYKNLQTRVLAKFVEEASEFYHPNDFKLIETALSSEQEEEIDINDIPL